MDEGQPHMESEANANGAGVDLFACGFERVLRQPLLDILKQLVFLAPDVAAQQVTEALEQLGSTNFSSDRWSAISSLTIAILPISRSISGNKSCSSMPK
jgi:hypothetical protein